MQALSHYKVGNLAVLLQGLDTPVMFDVNAGTACRRLPYRFARTCTWLGPNANPNLGGLPATEGPELLNVLNGVPRVTENP